MEAIALSTDIRPHRDSDSAWQDVVCKVIHNVRVRDVSTRDFAASISGRRYGDVSCARFWCKPHHVASGRESYGNAGSAGYLLSWQIDGEAHIEQNNTQIRLMPGGVAIVDSRHPMQVSFTQDVRRIVAHLPARSVEDSLSSLMRTHTLSFQPQGSLSNMLLCYLSEISSTSSDLELIDLPALADNICNLLKVMATRSGLANVSSREIRRQAVARYLRQVACDPAITLDAVAGKLNMSRRLLQKILQEMDSNFTDFVTEQRLLSAARKLDPAASVPISDVAYRSGFNDVSHFNHLFKRRFGMTPTEYRLYLGTAS